MAVRVAAAVLEDRRLVGPEVGSAVEAMAAKAPAAAAKAPEGRALVAVAALAVVATAAGNVARAVAVGRDPAVGLWGAEGALGECPRVQLAGGLVAVEKVAERQTAP